jgi:hypothetical protein
MPKSKDTGTQAHGKFVPTCHNYGKIGHIRPNCYLLKSHRPWIKQDALRKSEVGDSSSAKYVPPHRKHIKGKGKIRNSNIAIRTSDSCGLDAGSSKKEIFDSTSTVRTTAFHGPDTRTSDMEIAC